MNMDPIGYSSAEQEFISSTQLFQLGENIPLDTIHDTVLPDEPRHLFRVSQTDEIDHRTKFINSVVHHATEPSHEEGPIIATLSAFLLKRPSINFLTDACDCNVDSLASMFFNGNGQINTVRNRTIAKVAKGRGDLLIITTVEVHPDHQGNDLGVQLLFRTLIDLHGKWTLAVIEPQSMSWFDLEWQEQQQQYTDQQRPNLIRHFARLGFVQLGRDVAKAAVMYLPSTKFFRSPKSPISIISKQDSYNIKLHTPMPYQPTGVNKTLFDKLSYHQNPFTAMLPDPSTYSLLEHYLSVGATAHESRALHKIAPQAVKPDIIVLLLRHGADLNARDEDGNTALHKAAEMTSPTITYLVERGADPNLVNREDETAFDILLHALAVHQASFNFQEDKPTPDKNQVADMRNAVIALLPKQLLSRLFCGCIPPRVHEMLILTASHAAMTTEDVINQVFVSNNTNVTKITDLGGYPVFLEYMPEHVLLNNQDGFHKHLLTVWMYIFIGIVRCLDSGKLPTVQHVWAFLKSHVDKALLVYFFRHGGRVEYAMDGMISVTANIAQGCAFLNEIWDYGEHKRDIEALPETCLDQLYNVVSAMCFEGCDNIPHGPYEASMEILVDSA